MSVMERIPGKDIGNANWWGRQFGALGWMAQVRIRRKERRQTHREWFKAAVYNYNYSDEAKEKSREQRSLLTDADRDDDLVTDGGTDEIVPEDFDLEAAKNAHSTTSPDERKRCPECKRSTVCRKVDDHRKREIDTEYYCIQCLTHFDEPLTENPFTDGGTDEVVDDRDVATDSGLEEVYRRETISEGADGGLQIGDRETIEEIDDVCAALEAIREDVENADVDDALQTAISHAWQASVLQRVDENTDVRMITSSGSSGVVVHGPDPESFERNGGDTQ